MKKTICDKCKVSIDDRARDYTMAHIRDADGHIFDLCDSCYGEYRKIHDEASKQFNATIQTWINSWLNTEISNEEEN